MRVNGRALYVERPGFCTIEELISGEVREELRWWQYYMARYFEDISIKDAIKHDWHERHRGALRQRGWGYHGN